MSHNFSEVCLTPQQMRMYGNEAEKYLQRYFYPCVVLFGLAGNLLNLTVLLNKSMRSRSNSFLAALAFSDIIFLVLVFPNILANYPIFTNSYYYRYFYFYSKVHLISFANWSSCIAIWCVIAVCADRLVGIRDPLYVITEWEWYRMPLILTTIVLSTGIVTFYQHFQYECLVRSYCKGTQIYSKCIAINNDGRWFGNRTNPFSLSFRKFIDISVMINAVSMVLLPIFLLTVLNLMLLFVLRNRSSSLLLDSDAPKSKSSKDGQCQLQRTEQRVTLTVALIVTMFTVTNGPSAVIHLIQTAHPKMQLYNMTLLCNTLVICGKACNFILFCLSSKHFRRRLIFFTQRKVSRQFTKLSNGVLDIAANAHRRVSRVQHSIGISNPLQSGNRSLG
uniref:G-protein coupled receptor n=1 Tax=Ascaris suum TaxID=6253 RepID=F1L5A7_ASCSU